MAEINVTPFVDVMLVLLIVFMISAPLLTSGVPVDLPETQAKPLSGTTEPITISIDPRGRIFLQSTEIAETDLVAKLRAIAKAGVEERIFVRGDQTASYGTVMRVMGDLNAAGFNRIALVTIPVGDR
ncbi:MAG: protein TolR [Bauldia sp.]